MFKRFSGWILRLDRPKKRAVQLSLDTGLIVVSCLLAMTLRLDNIDFIFQQQVWNILVLVVPLTLFVFVRAGLYRAIIRYISSKAMNAILIGTAFSGALMFLSNLFLGHLIPRSVPIIYFVILFCLIAGSRFLARAFFHASSAKPSLAVVIWGAGDAGRQLLNALHIEREYQVIAFIDDDPTLHGREIDTIPIQAPSALDDLKEKFGIKSVLLAAPNAKISDRRRIISFVETHALQLRTIPGVREIISGRSDITDLTDIQVEDLLVRETIAPLSDLTTRKVENKVVMVTGAGGSIGGELCRQIVALRPNCIVLYEISEFALYRINEELSEFVDKKDISTSIMPFIGSVQNSRRLAHIFSKIKVETIFHAAAYKHVPLVEQNIIEGIQNNLLGTQTLITAAIEAGVETFTLVSTDKAVRPTNFMGASKRIAELVCQAHASSRTGTCISIVRFGNVMWSSGSVLPKFKEQILAGGPVMVTHPEITRYFMTISEAAQLVMQAGAMAKGGEVFVLDMGKPVKILDIAKSMIRLHGMVPYFEADGGTVHGDICISFSGLRPGEKLHEELLVGDNVSGTAHPRIMCADEAKLDVAEINSLLDELQDACDAMDTGRVKEIILGAAVDFKPDDFMTDLLTDPRESEPDIRGTTGSIVHINQKRKKT